MMTDTTIRMVFAPSSPEMRKKDAFYFNNKMVADLGDAFVFRGFAGTYVSTELFASTIFVIILQMQYIPYFKF